MTRSSQIDNLMKEKYPIKCAKCFSKIEAPKMSKSSRRPVFRKIGKDWRIVCTDCVSTGLPSSWIEKFGDTNLNGMPVDANKKPCSLNKAFGFRRYKNENGKRVAYYAKKKTQSR